MYKLPQLTKLPSLTNILCCLLLTTLSGAAIAQGDQDEVTLSDLTWSDENEFKRKVTAITNLASRNFGRPVRGDMSDLRLLQRIADQQLIAEDDLDRLQALGVVLGNVMKAELGLEWKVYEDDKGRSRALCVPNSKHCLFPITMLSRRLETGLDVNVQETYERAASLIEPYLPDDNAYDGKREAPSSRPSWINDRKKDEERPKTIPIR